MKPLHLTQALALLLLSLLLSCDPADSEAPDTSNTSSEAENEKHYFPLAVGNSWTYDNPKLGEYNITVTGASTLDGLHYFELTNSTKGNHPDYARYDVNKMYSRSTINGHDVEFLLLDEDAGVGDTWTAAKIVNSNHSSTITTAYTCELTDKHSSFAVGPDTYQNVVEVTMTTSAKFLLNRDSYEGVLTDQQMDEEEAYYQNLYSEMTSVKQVTYYALDVGFIFQYSTDVPNLGTVLEDYTVN